MFYQTFISLCSKVGKSPLTVVTDIGLGNSAAAYWKKGAIPRETTMKKLADYFGVSVEYLTTGVEEKENPAQVAEPAPGVDELMKLYNMLTPENQAAVKLAALDLLKEQMQL